MSRLFGLLLLVVTLSANASVVPEQLKEWQSWVLDKHPKAQCSFLWNKFDEKHCAWPYSLALTVSGSTASFTQRWDVEADSWLALPGSDRHWPQQVKVNGAVVAVVKHRGRPAVKVAKGKVEIQGQLRWDKRPQYLQLPKDTALVTLTVDAKRSPLVNIDAQSKLWFAPKVQKAQVTSSNVPTRVQIFRKIIDGVPLNMQSHLRIEVSGEPRELLLSNALLPGFSVVHVDSPLPARVESNGAIRMQLRQGRWDIKLSARANKPLASFQLGTPSKLSPAQEIWVFEQNVGLRSVELSGAAMIDSSQSNLPEQWRALPAYLMEGDTTLTLVERSRGDAQPAPNTLGLQREFWLDFSGSGLTVSDTLSGDMQRAMRLSTTLPFVLGRAEVNSQPSLLSTLDGDTSGLEIGQGDLSLYAVSRIDSFANWKRTLPAVGWAHDVDSLQAQVHLPPGWQALAASGVDSAPYTWLAQWSLYDIFLVLVIVMAFYRLFSLPVAAMFAVLMLITYHDRQIPMTLWLIIAVTQGLASVIHTGLAKRILGLFRDGSLAVLCFVSLSFAAQQLQHAMYPVLSQSRTVFDYQTMAGASDAYEDESVLMEPSMSRAKIAIEHKMSSPRRGQFEEVVVTAAKEYDPDSYVQTGPGLPSWQWHSLDLAWSGPVLADQQLVIYTIPPWATRLLKVISVLLLALLIFSLLRSRLQTVISSPKENNNGASLVSLCVAVMFASIVGLQSSPAHAEFPSQSLLKELESRLLKAPQCVPECATINSVAVHIKDDQLRLSLSIDSASNSVVLLPASRGAWLPTSVQLNGKPATALGMSQQGVMQLAFDKGHHRLVLSGRLHGEQISLPFAMTAHNVSAHAEGWQVSGISRSMINNKTLQLKKIISKKDLSDNSQQLLPAPVTAFVTVQRRIEFSVDWNVVTTVTRLAPHQGVINLKIPLLAQEQLLSGVKAKNGLANVTMAAGQKRLQWRSRLKPSDSVELVAPSGESWVEQWQLVADDGRWNMRWQGLAPIKQANARAPKWQPRAGDSLTVLLRKPQAVAGVSQTIEHVDIQTRPGLRTTDVVMTLSLRAGQGGNFAFDLPEGAQLLSMSRDGESLPLPNSKRVEFPVLPGLQDLVLSWQRPQALSFKSTTPIVDVGIAATNISLRTEVPKERWMLLVGGPELGPAILFWGVFFVVVVLAIGLGRLRFLPLKTWEWLLLGIGISTINSFFSLVIVLWFMAMYWRGIFDRSKIASWFNLIQCGLILASVVALICLLAAIPMGLLSTPNMHIAGNGSSSYMLQWYQDRSTVELPTAWFISLPLWVYRVAMLLWSLWIASALMRWAPWGWQQFSRDGWWDKKVMTANSKAPNRSESLNNKEEDLP